MDETKSFPVFKRCMSSNVLSEMQKYNDRETGFKVFSSPAMGLEQVCMEAEQAEGSGLLREELGDG